MMKKEKQCQSCGIPLDKNTPQGTEENGSLSLKYCIHCYQNGQWTLDLSFDEMYDYNLKRFQESDMNKFQKMILSKMYTKKFMRKLDRWK
ncbi:putative zinc ribbon domain protein [Staphylococcus arlettae]|nr:putative zinc ribbon domain protein [Staphylococcus arlettae]